VQGQAWSNRAGMRTLMDGTATTDTQTQEPGLIAAVSRSHPDTETSRYLAALPLRATIACGSSLKFCLIARGDADIYPRFGPTNEWDIAAGDAIVRAAKGDVIAADGSAFRYGKPGFGNGPYVARSPKAIRLAKV
jgi:3'(2'), 5'-bisphosphate nucleotidase